MKERSIYFLATSIILVQLSTYVCKYISIRDKILDLETCYRYTSAFIERFNKTRIRYGSHRQNSCWCQGRIWKDDKPIWFENNYFGIKIRKGGTLIEYQGKLRLLEIAQVPKDHIDEFKSVSKFRLESNLNSNKWILTFSISVSSTLITYG